MTAINRADPVTTSNTLLLKLHRLIEWYQQLVCYSLIEKEKVLFSWLALEMSAQVFYLWAKIFAGIKLKSTE